MIRNWLRNFMIGRYGPDQLYFALFIVSIVLSIAARITGLGVLSLVGMALLLLALFRSLSRNIYKRRAENDRFLRFWWPIRTWFGKKFRRAKDKKNFRFFKCPSCKNTLRVPKGKGKIQVTCPRCGERFIKKS